MKRWIAIFALSLVMYKTLWAVMEIQLGELSFDKEEMIWDPIQCAVFSSTVLVINMFFRHFKKGRYAHSLIEIVCLISVNGLIIFLTNKFFFALDSQDDNFWNVIDIYVIGFICTAISIIDIQHNYHKRLLEMERERMLLRLRLLQRQLSPHFMFNSLSMLQGLVIKDPQKAEEYLLTFSEILRYITTNIGKEKVALSEATAFIENYMKMLEARFPKNFIMDIQSDNAPRNAFVVPVSMQIAVENAIKHNDHSPQHPLQISIAFDNEWVEVRNNKQLLNKDKGFGIGLRNLSERYKLLAGKGLSINEDENYYSVKIPLMYESANSGRRNSKLRCLKR